jgi:hypothetical protein
MFSASRVVKPVPVSADIAWKRALDLSMPVASSAIEPNHNINSHTVNTTNINSGCILTPRI